MEKRNEKRLRYNWPVWFANDFSDVLSQGQMVDVTSEGASFTCYADKCPDHGEHITTRFSVPNYGSETDFELENFIRDGKICRIDEISPHVRRVALAFNEVLPFKPGEVNDDTEALVSTADENLQVAALAASEANAMADEVQVTQTQASEIFEGLEV